MGVPPGRGQCSLPQALGSQFTALELRFGNSNPTAMAEAPLQELQQSSQSATNGTIQFMVLAVGTG